MDTTPGETRPAPRTFFRLEISDSMREEWQSVVDLIARIAGVRAALIMRVEGDTIEAFVASRTRGSPYRAGSREILLHSGLYCERVVRTRSMLHVPDAAESDEWRNNPDMKYGMRCYLGFPIRLPDGSIFGTICMLDDRKNDFSQDMKDFMEKMRNLIESYLSLLHLSVTDALTGLYNRTFMNLRAGKILEEARRSGRPVSALLLDLDRFKRINDGSGHLEGDRVLRRFAGVILDSLRGDDLAFRFGGDEVVVLLPGKTLPEAASLAEKMRAKVEEAFAGEGRRITVSAGAAAWIPGESQDRWFRRMDQTLYRAKRHGRNRVGI